MAMNEPRTLFLDQSGESRLAEQARKEAHLEFAAVSIEDPAREGKRFPRLVTLQGLFESLESIRWYARAYGRSSTTSGSRVV